jgi:hypothetical protein
VGVARRDAVWGAELLEPRQHLPLPGLDPWGFSPRTWFRGHPRLCRSLAPGPIVTQFEFPISGADRANPNDQRNRRYSPPSGHCGMLIQFPVMGGEPTFKRSPFERHWSAESAAARKRLRQQQGQAGKGYERQHGARDHS